MGKFNILVVCLIAGILGTTIAEDSEESITSGGEVWTHGLKDVFVFLLESGKGVEHFREDCNKHGGAEAYNNLVKSAKNLSTLIVNPYMNDWGNLAVGCTRFSVLSKLNRNLLTSYKNCLEPETRDNVDDDGILFPLLGLMCEIKANHTMDSYQFDPECIPRHCISRTYASNYYTINVAEFASHLLTSDLRREECQIIDEAHTCILESLKGCRNSRLSDIAKALFRILDEHTSCDKFIQASTASINVGDHVSP